MQKKETMFIPTDFLPKRTYVRLYGPSKIRMNLYPPYTDNGIPMLIFGRFVAKRRDLGYMSDLY